MKYEKVNEERQKYLEGVKEGAMYQTGITVVKAQKNLQGAKERIHRELPNISDAARTMMNPLTFVMCLVTRIIETIHDQRNIQNRMHIEHRLQSHNFQVQLF